MKCRRNHLQFKDLNISRTRPRWWQLCLESTILLRAPSRGEDQEGRRTRRERGPQTSVTPTLRFASNRLPVTFWGQRRLKMLFLNDEHILKKKQTEHNRKRSRREGWSDGQGYTTLNSVPRSHYNISKPVNNDHIEKCVFSTSHFHIKDSLSTAENKTI